MSADPGGGAVSACSVRDYYIISVNDERAETKARARAALAGWVEHDFNAVDGSVARGRDHSELAKFFADNPFVKFSKWHPRTAEAGYWGSLVNACHGVVEAGVPVAVLEDDAEIGQDFTELVDSYLSACDSGIDAFQLFTWVDKANPRMPPLPRPSDSKLVCENWNEWPFGGAVIFPSGAAKFIDYLRSNPITATGDVMFSQMCKAGVLRAMAPAPYQPSPVALNHGKVKSTIDGTRPVPERLLPKA